MSGSGTFVFPDGQVYEGEFVDIDGKRVRQGKVLTAVAPSLPNPLSAGDVSLTASSVCCCRWRPPLLPGAAQGTLTDGPETYVGGWDNDAMAGEGA